ncbi:M23 family metallopeptidase [Sporosarcina globispora]|uniref:M23 family metallopeptidase n=1 Tax=Sporosarcina globispora TaxID=1459 RepID=UPI0006A9C4E5|nr:M23 family metallopeptidase [Sporosarcina globispora]
MYKITSRYLQQESFRSSPHKGIDFKMEIGEPIRSIKSGQIHLADYGNTNAGKTVFVEWEDGRTAIYGHLNEFAVKEGQHVNAGDLIGYAGNTGFSTGSHLHFSVKEGSKHIDPSPYMNDIQHMNDPSYFAQVSSDVKVSFFDYFQQHMDLIGTQLTDLKVNFVHFLALSDYSPIIKLLQNVIQFIFFNI